MIVVVGRIASGPASEIARRIARRGAGVEVVSTVSPDAAGDRLLAELTANGVGHAAVLRSPAPSLEAADVDLAMRYLPDVRVIVLADRGELERTVQDAASWTGGTLIVLGPDSAETADADAASAAERGSDSGSHAASAVRSGSSIRLAAPERDPDGAFAGVVAELATRLDGGDAPDAAWAATAAALGLERISPRR